MLDLDKLPPTLQVIAAFGALIAGGVLWVLGARRKGNGEIADKLRTDLAAATRAIEMRDLRVDLGDTVRAMRESLLDEIRSQSEANRRQFEDLSNRMQSLEIEFSHMDDHRPRGRPK